MQSRDVDLLLICNFASASLIPRDLRIAIRLATAQDYLTHLSPAASCKRRGDKDRWPGPVRGVLPASQFRGGCDEAGESRPCSFLGLSIRLESAGEGAAVDQDVLAGEIAGVRR